MRRVIVETPYRGDREKHARYLAACLKDCYSRGESPYASHAIGPLALDDEDPIDRDLGIRAGWAWHDLADAIVVYEDLGLTPGMRLSIAAAAQIRGKLIEYRRLGGEWSA